MTNSAPDSYRLGASKTEVVEDGHFGTSGTIPARRFAVPSNNFGCALVQASVESS